MKDCKEFVRRELNEWLKEQPESTNFGISQFEDTFIIRRKSTGTHKRGSFNYAADTRRLQANNEGV